MDKNKFILKPSTAETINKFLIASGYGTIDCNYRRVYKGICNSSDNYDQTNGRAILKSEFVYLPDFPSKVIDYDKMVQYGKDKYYWDSLNQRLYKFKLRDTIRPFVAQRQVIVGCDVEPSAGGISADLEFTKSKGIWQQVTPDHAISNYIVVKGHPEQYALRPYVENVYYFDIVNNKYYFFISNYTRNINNWYYNRSVENTEVLKYIYESERELDSHGNVKVTGEWIRVNSGMILPGNPNDLITIVDNDENTEEEPLEEIIEPSEEPEEPVEEEPYPIEIDIDDVDRKICYCDKSTNTLYYFDYGQYFERVLFSGVIYERPFDFYRKMQDVFLDISGTKKVLTKDIYYISGHPRKVKNPKEQRFYYDSKNQRYYEYHSADNSWVELTQDNLLIPQSYFPHTNGDMAIQVTLAYYNIIDCYTKKEVDRLMPVIPGYISYFDNDMGYIFAHQDISGKQDLLTIEQLITLNSGVTYDKVLSWGRLLSLINNKQDKLSAPQLEALDSGITAEKVAHYDSISALIDSKANKSTTLRGYGITNAYTTAELERCLNNLKNQLDNAN